MNKSETIASLAPALVAAQAEIKNPAFNARNPHFKSNYVNLAGLRDAITPVLSQHGLAALQLLSTGAEGEVCCETMLLHSSGEWISETFCIKPGKADAHGCGSAATYARRYALAAMIGVAGEDDDDGNAAVAPGANERITETQVADLQALAEEVAADVPKFLEYLSRLGKAKIGGFDEIPASLHKQAVQLLQKKRGA